MRLVFIIILFIFSASVKAQTPLPGNYTDHLQQQYIAGNNRFSDSVPGRKWLMSRYMGLSTGIGFFNGRSATLLAVPAGIQLNRRLNNNWYAFAGVAVAPAYVNFNRSFLAANNNKFPQNNSLLTAGHFDLYSRAELGLMYINDQKTFSISGSFGVERSSNPFVPLNQNGTPKRNSFIVPAK